MGRAALFERTPRKKRSPKRFSRPASAPRHLLNVPIESALAKRSGLEAGEFEFVPRRRYLLSGIARLRRISWQTWQSDVAAYFNWAPIGGSPRTTGWGNRPELKAPGVISQLLAVWDVPPGSRRRFGGGRLERFPRPFFFSLAPSVKSSHRVSNRQTKWLGCRRKQSRRSEALPPVRTRSLQANQLAILGISYL